MAFLGDLLPTSHHLPLAYVTAWDGRPLDTLERKRQFLAQAETEGWLLIFGHGLGLRAGYLVRRDGRLGVEPREV